MEEIFKDVVGYEGLYQVSNMGSVKSIPRKNRWKEKLLSINHRSLGYMCVHLCKDGIPKVASLHRLVAAAFLGPSNLFVDHIDGNKANNKLENLRYLTHRENITAGFLRKGGHSSYTGVSWNKPGKYWQARIGLNGKYVALGNFKDEEKAAAAYQEYLSKNKINENERAAGLVH